MFQIGFVIGVAILTIIFPKGADILLLIANIFIPDMVPLVDEGIQVAIIYGKFSNS